MKVSITYVDDNGIALGRWLKKIRLGKTTSVSPDIQKNHTERLAEIGVIPNGT